jgi:glycosyltransferase involved in cell wall biosynthesis
MADFASFVQDVEGLVAQNTVVQDLVVRDTKPPTKLLLISTHLNQASGYSKVSYGLLRELGQKEGLQITHFAIQASTTIDFKRPYPSSIKVVDAGKEENGFGFKQIAEVIKAEEPHVVMIYNDIGICCQYLEKIVPLRQGAQGLSFQIWLYLDQVYECQLPPYLQLVQKETDRIFCFTQEWRSILKNQGITRPIDVLKHGFDPSLFPRTDKDELRARLGIPKDTFLFLSANRNQPRKRLDLLIMAFVELILQHPTKSLFLMCVCDKGEKGGFPLYEIFHRELLIRGSPVEPFANRLMVTPREMSYTDAEIGQLYQLADVGVSTADGEGFGLCVFEQMGLGIPQVISNVAGHREYCTKDNSQLVDPVFRSYLPLSTSLLGGETRMIHPSIFAKAMSQYALDPDLRKEHGIAAQKTVAAYTWSSVTETLCRRLKQLDLE